MNQYKDIRAFRQEHGEEITLQNVAIHGNADINEELPESFTISLTPSMLRLKKSWNAINDRTDISGFRVISCDVKSSLPSHKVRDVRILVYRQDHNNLHCTLMIHDSWLDGNREHFLQQAKYKNKKVTPTTKSVSHSRLIITHCTNQAELQHGSGKIM